MSKFTPKTALIIGAGSGISASFAKRLAAEGVKVGLAARSTDKLAELASQIKADVYRVDCGEKSSVQDLFRDFDAKNPGGLDILLFNAGNMGDFGPIEGIDADKVHQSLQVGAFGAFVAAQEAARRMLPRGQGAILFTGATAAVKAFAEAHSFAMSKFAQRGLAQSLARELAPKGIHVCHFNIDGGVYNPATLLPDAPREDFLDPDAIADTYWYIATQHRSAWTWEVELRPFKENW